MIWAIDLDDGTLINALGSNLDRKKDEVYSNRKYFIPDFGTSWDVTGEL
jgi:chitinase